MKKNILRFILMLLLIFTCYIIFGFSNQDGEKSSSISRKITEIITKNIKDIQNLNKNKKAIVLKKIEYIVRKIAHFTLYTLVGFLIMSLCYTYSLEQRKRLAISILCSSTYAISDEVHQSFIPGRSSQITDVFIDICGALTGILAIVVLIYIYKKYIKKVAIKK